MAKQTWPRTIAEAIAVNFTIDTPGGYMRVSVQAVPE